MQFESTGFTEYKLGRIAVSNNASKCAFCALASKLTLLKSYNITNLDRYPL